MRLSLFISQARLVAEGLALAPSREAGLSHHVPDTRAGEIHPETQPVTFLLSFLADVMTTTDNMGLMAIQRNWASDPRHPFI